jgi:hypothetical protein
LRVLDGRAGVVLAALRDGAAVVLARCCSRRLNSGGGLLDDMLRITVSQSSADTNLRSLQISNN